MKTMLKNKCSLLVKGSLMLVVFIATVLVCTSCRDDDDDENTPPVPVSANSSCPDANHPHMIDLALPLGTKWACCNVGATAPELIGGYYSWGETTEKKSYAMSVYQHYDKTTKNIIYIGDNIAGTKYDAATANWGDSWCMPTVDQIQTLVKYCTSEWTTENFVEGRRFTGRNGNSIFIPSSGWKDYSGVIGLPRGCIMSSSLDTDNPLGAWGLFFSPTFATPASNDRAYGCPVRPVSRD